MSSSSSFSAGYGRSSFEDAPDPKKSRKDYYEYIGFEEAAVLLRISEGASGKKATSISQEKINCYGVVVSYTQPKELHNKASKYMASYFIVDPTLPYNATSAAICLNIFADELSQLPIVHSAGDILRCHRVKVNFWNGLQLVGTIYGENASVKSKTNGSSFVTFHGKFDPSTGLLPVDPSSPTDVDRAQVHSSKDGPPMPRRASSEKAEAALGAHYFEVHATTKEFSWNGDELKLVRGYRTWAASMLMKHRLQDSLTATYNLDKLTQLLAQQAASNDRRGGLVIPNTCDVIGIFVGLDSKPSATPGGTAQTRVRVWDGTQALGSMVARPTHLNNAALRNDTAADGMVSRETLAAVEVAVHASCIYQTCSELCDVETLRSRILGSAQDKENPPQSYMGAPMAFEIACPGAQKFLAALQPGTWLRFRALKLVPGLPVGMNTPLASPIPRVGADTHVVMLPPYAHDPARIATDFRARIQEGCRVLYNSATIRTQNQIPASTSGAGAGAGAGAGVNVGAGGNQRPMAPPLGRRLTHTSAGEELTNIALLTATPAPAKFVMRAKVSGHWPRDVTKFTVDAAMFNAEVAGATGAAALSLLGQKKKPATASVDVTDENSENASSPSALDLVNGHIHKPREYLFSITAEDDSGDIDLIFSGRDAELLLGGISADDFHASVEAEQAAAAATATAAPAAEEEASITSQPKPTEIVKRVRQRLEELIRNRNNNGILQFYVRSYGDIQGTGVGKVPTPSKGGRPAARTLPVEYRRFAGFNTKLFQ